MNASDVAHEETNRKIVLMGAWLATLYGRAAGRVRAQMRRGFDAIQAEATRLLRQIAIAKTDEERRKAEADYKRFFSIRVMRVPEFRAAVNDAANELLRTNEAASEFINSQTPEVYAKNYNAVGGDLASDIAGYPFLEITEADAAQFGELTQQSVKRRENVKWNVRNILAVVVAGALLLRRPDEILEDAVSRTVSRNLSSASRQASDMCTDAETKAQLDSMERAQDTLDVQNGGQTGYRIKKQWISTLDNRTREAHIERDGQIIELWENFAPGLSRPRDPHGEKEEICNCRCRLVYVTPTSSNNGRASRVGDVTGSYKKDSSFTGTQTARVPYMNYREWMKWRGR